MTEWSKLKVADLRAELKKRNLPQTGNKSVLVERLAAAENGNGSESDATIQGDPSKIDGDSATSPDDVSPILPGAADSLPDVLKQTNETEETSNMQTTEEHILQTAPPTVAEPTHTIESSQPPAPKDTHTSTLPSVEPQEANEDRQKRKRRSQSPPPSATDVARKRLRVSDADTVGDGVVATSADDADWVDKHNGVNTEDIAVEVEVARDDVGEEPTAAPAAADSIMDGVVEENSHGEAKIDEKDEGLQISKPDEMDVDTPVKAGGATPAVYDESPSRARDSRFKTLFSGDGPGPYQISRDPIQEETEPDRIISPAIHPATSGLYISQLMRPINPAQFQAHLAVLAAPPDSKVDPDAVARFYVDPIRTHAFALFTSVSAAARVRSALHDRIWPDEKTRKPLWVDFVPADKVVDWIDQEQASNPGARSMGKKWEVYYDVDEDNRVTAILQEANTAARPMQQTRQPSISVPRPQAQITPRKIEAPSGPRSAQPLPPSTRRLDELFKSTTAKPMLYWQPVPKELVDRRLDNIDRALSKDAAAGRRIDGDSHRYTFEDSDALVDRGPEIFSGIRPPPGVRGGGRRGGGYQGRGGFGGGDSFRPNNDRRNNGPSYRGDRRESRDYGRR